MTSLYNACADKGSTPTSKTILAIVTAVENIKGEESFSGQTFSINSSNIYTNYGVFSEPRASSHQSSENGLLYEYSDSYFIALKKLDGANITDVNISPYQSNTTRYLYTEES